MSKEAFEKVFPVPEDVLCDSAQGYITNDVYNPTVCIAAKLQQGSWEAWQAATSAQEARVRELEEALLSILRLKEAEASLGGMRGGRIESIARKALSATAREPKS